LFDLQSPQLVEHSCSATTIRDLNKVIIIIIITSKYMTCTRSVSQLLLQHTKTSCVQLINWAEPMTSSLFAVGFCHWWQGFVWTISIGHRLVKPLFFIQNWSYCILRLHTMGTVYRWHFPLEFVQSVTMFFSLLKIFCKP